MVVVMIVDATVSGDVVGGDIVSVYIIIYLFACLWKRYNIIVWEERDCLKQTVMLQKHCAALNIYEYIVQ